MDYLSIKPSRNSLNDFIKMINLFVKQKGYVFVYDEVESTIKLTTIYPSDVTVKETTFIPIMGDEKKPLLPSDLKCDYETSDGEKICLSAVSSSDNIDYIKSVVLEVFSQDNSVLTLFFEYKYFDSMHPFQAESNLNSVFEPVILVTNATVSFDNKIISFDRYSDTLNFINNSDSQNSVQIAVKRNTNSHSKIIFTSVLDGKVTSISSAGDENWHKLSNYMNLPDEPFTVTYEEYRPDGGLISMDHLESGQFKHYSNVKLINNKNVRKILDDVMDSYKKTFPYVDLLPDENGLLGGYLFNAYINGEPNNRIIAENFLKAINIPLNNSSVQRKKSMRKDN